MMKIVMKTIPACEVEDVGDIICNCCGESLKAPSHAETGSDWRPYYAGKYTGGWASIVGDMARYRWEVCEPCLKRWWDSFKHPPSSEDVEIF